VHITTGSKSGHGAAVSGGDYLRIGQLATVRQFCNEHNATHVVLNFAASGSNLTRINEALNRCPVDEKPRSIIVQDRTALVLEIFTQHATTAEARLQVKLAGAARHAPTGLTA
jgi:GTPase